MGRRSGIASPGLYAAVACRLIIVVSLKINKGILFQSGRRSNVE
jgi:hypothetical protein